MILPDDKSWTFYDLGESHEVLLELKYWLELFICSLYGFQKFYFGERCLYMHVSEKIW